MEQVSASDNSDTVTEFVNVMEKNMDPNVDPCEDFFSYASGRLDEDNYNENLGEYCPSYYGDPLERVLINETFKCDLIRKVRDFHSSVPTTVGAFLEDEGLRDFCGGFPAFNSNWSPENFNWIRAVAMLSAMGVETILCNFTQYLGRRRIVTISAKQPDQRLIRIADNVLSPIQLNKEQFADIINAVNCIKEKLDRIAVNYQRETIRRHFEELSVEPFDYQTYFETFIGQPIDPDDIFDLTSYAPGYLDSFLNIFLETPAKMVANYITFMTACAISEQYDPFKITQRHFGSGLLAVGLGFYLNPLETQKRTEVLQYVTRISKAETHASDDQIANVYVNRDQEILEFINSHLTYEKVSEEYKNLEVIQNHFFQSLDNIRRVGTPASMKKYSSCRDEDIGLFQGSRSLLECLQCHHDKPKLCHFAGWALDKCRTLISSLSYHDLIEDYPTVEQCLKDQLLNYEFHQEDDFSEEWFQIQFGYYVSTIEAFRIAFKSYTAWLAEHEELRGSQDEAFKRLNLDSKKAFFVWYVQQNCESDLEYVNAAYLAIVNSEFSEFFDCTTNSPMYLDNKCKIKWNKR